MSDSYFNWKQKEIQEEELGPFNPPENVPPLVRTKETGDKVYLVKDGYAHWITSPEVLQAVGGDFGMVQTIDRSIFRQLRIAEKLTLENASLWSIGKVETVVVDEVAEGKTFKVDEKHFEEDFYGKGEFEQEQKLVDELNKNDIPASVVTEEEKKFATYEDPAIESAPKIEPIKGLTSIIIPVHWNSYLAFHYTGSCIGSIREHTDKEKTPYEIILVINGKTGITIEKLSDTYADKVIENEENEGFAKAVNKAIRCASGEFIAVVNSDVLVFDKWLQDLQTCIDENYVDRLDLVMATPMYGKPFARAVEAKELSSKWEGTYAKDSFSDFRDFSCILTRKSMFDQIGLFDEQFFMYCEDLDLMRRMDQAGLKYASTKRVNTHHIIGATSSGNDATPEIMNESKAKLLAKWGY